jgi:hypothetical protein
MHRFLPLAVLAACAAPSQKSAVVEGSGLRLVVVHVDRLE